MSTTGTERSGLEQLSAALRRGAPLAELLDLADSAIEHSVDVGDTGALEQLASRLETAAARRGPEARGLRVAAARARAALPRHPTAAEPTPPSEALAHASWGRRVGAFVVDWILIGAASWLPGEWISDAAYVTLWAFLFPFVYFTAMHALFGRTVGKRVLGIAVRRTDGDRIDTATAVGRTLTQALLAFTVVGFLVDSLWPLRDARGRALHDKAADTIVVR